MIDKETATARGVIVLDNTSINKGYELTFAGKGLTRAMANTESLVLTLCSIK